jgi:effector-binding domain-containing protein
MSLVRNLAIGAVALVGAGGGALYVATPSKVEKEVTFTVDRPLATVYAMLASAPGESAVVDGVTQTVTALELRKTVEADVTFLTNKRADITYTLTPADKATSVVLHVRHDLGLNPAERVSKERGDQVGTILTSLQSWVLAEAAKTKTADFSDLTYEVATRTAQPYLYLEGSTTKGPGQISDGARQATAILKTVFASNNLAMTNPISVETAWTGDTYGFNFGMPYSGQRPAVLIGVKAGETPSGTAIKVNYTGSEDTIITQVYDKIDALIAATRLTEGPNFEVYLDDPTQVGGSRNREVYYIVTGDTEGLLKYAPSAPRGALAPAPAPVEPSTVTPTPAPAATPAPAPATTP